MRLKYSKARRSSWMTPSPSAYIRPSFHCATGWPPSAAYCSELSEGATTAVAGADVFFRAWAFRAAAAGWVTTGRAASCWFIGAPSNANPGPAAGAAPNINARMIRLDVRIALFLVRTAWMGHSPINRRPNLLGIFPQRTRRMISLSGLPFGLTFSELGVGQLYVKSPDVGVDLDDVTILQQGDRAAHALTGQRRCGGEHFPHAGTAARSLIADHDHLALLVGLLLDRLEGVFFAIEAAGRTGKFQLRHARDLHDRALRRKITLQADHTASDGDRLVGGPHHILVRIPFHALEVFGDRTARDGQAIPVQVAIVEQRLHQQRNAANFKHVFCDITATWFQICDIRSLFEDFRNVEQIELDAAFIGD